jgi:Holliday junction DNA helicase RuvA
MIAHLQGKLVEKHQPKFIDCGGVGYHVNISLHTYSLLPDFIKLFTHLQIKEDSFVLVFLKSQKERSLDLLFGFWYRS